ncbi:mannose-1-phosphate guanyltransferase alpha, partial [Alligator sinensis]|uniref:Mannose-1-phosphate guanyltransferase alpha n=1 Tax=Alligator sinensis TaxID=38654 RepID=A0A3Q0FJ66_ALLSI
GRVLSTPGPASAQVPNMKEILLVGFYQPNEALSRFLVSAQQEFKIPIRYLQEYAALGTGGGLYHFRDQILSGGPEAFFVLNADVCSEFPLPEMLAFQQQRGGAPAFVILGTTANRKQSLNYGCIVANADTHEVLHYVEKPSTFVSEVINCGIYLFTPAIFQHIGEVFQRNQQELLLYSCVGEETSNGWQRAEVIRLEQDVFTALAGRRALYVYKTDGFWSQIKSAGSAIYANRLYLSRSPCPRPGAVRWSSGFPHPMLCSPQDHTCVLNSIVGWDSTIGRWARVEGTPSDPNPNDPYAKIDSETLFRDGRLTPSITILGCNVTIPAEVVILNSIVLPHKELSRSYKNQIIL